MTETEASTRPREAPEMPSAESDLASARQAKAQQVVAYLSYALEDMRALSPTGTFLLEMSLVAVNEDMNLSQWSLQEFAGEGS